MTLEEFKSWYYEQYGVVASEKLIERFKELNNENKEIVNKVESKTKRK